MKNPVPSLNQQIKVYERVRKMDNWGGWQDQCQHTSSIWGAVEPYKRGNLSSFPHHYLMYTRKDFDLSQALQVQVEPLVLKVLYCLTSKRRSRSPFPIFLYLTEALATKSESAKL